VHQPQQIQLDSVERHDLAETFADSFNAIKSDGQRWRLEFCVTRMEQPIPPNILRGKQVPVCRLVLTPQLGLELASKLTAFIQEMEKQGVIKKTVNIPMPPISGKPN